jgi:hypothetical protein
MKPRLAFLGVISILCLLAQTQAQSESAAAFIGTWVGTQSWAMEDSAPNAQAKTPVELTIAMTDGKLTGKMTPFLGGTEGATLIKAEVVGGRLIAAGIFDVERPTPLVAAINAQRRVPNWKENVQVAFEFTTDRTDLKGTADLHVGEVPWLKFKYELSKKRSRYP